MNFIYPLFKFLNRKKYSEKFLNEGSIKIGTLYEYRNCEEYTKKVLDEKEGQFEITAIIDSEEDMIGKDLSGFGFYMMGKPEKNKFRFRNITFNSNRNDPNCYIYSTSAAFTTNVLKQAIDDGYISCVMIHEPFSFFSRVSENFQDSDFMGYHPCIYVDRKIELNYKSDSERLDLLSKLPGALIKPPDYKNQIEVRAIWKPKKQHQLLSPLRKAKK